jgi:hypothetical protein
MKEVSSRAEEKNTAAQKPGYDRWGTHKYNMTTSSEQETISNLPWRLGSQINSKALSAELTKIGRGCRETVAKRNKQPTTANNKRFDDNTRCQWMYDEQTRAQTDGCINLKAIRSEVSSVIVNVVFVVRFSRVCG